MSRQRKLEWNRWAGCRGVPALRPPRCSAGNVALASGLWVDVTIFDPRADAINCAVHNRRSRLPSSPVIRPALLHRPAQRGVAFAKCPEANQYFSTNLSAPNSGAPTGYSQEQPNGGACILMPIAKGYDVSHRDVDCIWIT